MRLNAARFFLFIAFLMVGSLVHSQEALLRYRWSEGDVFLLDKKIEISGTIQMGTRPVQPMTQTARLQKKITVVHVSSEGRAELESSLIAYSATKTIADRTTRIEADPERLLVDGKLLFDRGRDESRIKKISGRYADLFKKHTFWCSRRGETRSALRQDTIRKELAQSDPGAVFGIGEEGWLLFAEEAVGEGQSWSRTPEGGLIRDGTAEVSDRQEYQLLALPAQSGQPVRIGINKQWRAKNLYVPTQPEGLNTPVELGAWFNEKKELFQAEALFDAQKGYPVSYSSEGAVFMEYYVTRSRYYAKNPSAPLIYNWPQVRVETRWEKLK
jgi:hypothetical protein